MRSTKASTIFEFIRHVRMGPQRAGDRPCVEGAPRSRRAGEQVRPDQNPGGPNGVNGRPEYVSAGMRCESGAARRGRDRPVLPAPGRSIGSDRGDRRRDGQTGAAGQGAASRPVRSAPETIRRAHKVHPIAAVQTEYSLLYRAEAEETRETTRELWASASSPMLRWAAGS